MNVEHKGVEVLSPLYFVQGISSSNKLRTRVQRREKRLQEQSDSA